jgi:hypothetical protein
MKYDQLNSYQRLCIYQIIEVVKECDYKVFSSGAPNVESVNDASIV